MSIVSLVIAPTLATIHAKDASYKKEHENKKEVIVTKAAATTANAATVATLQAK